MPPEKSNSRTAVRNPSPRLARAIAHRRRKTRAAFIEQLEARQLMASDFGDAPDVSAGVGRGDYITLGVHGGPSHVIDATSNSLYLGAGVDADDGTAQDAAAAGDDRQGPLADDEDGLKYARDSNGTIGLRPNISFTVFNATGRDATLYGWIDYNANGQFENGAESASIIVPSTGSSSRHSLSLPAIPSGYIGPTYARFRLSSDPAAANPNGAAVGGEVEDHLFQINSTTATVPGTSNPYLAGLPNGATARFYDQAPAQSPVSVPDLPIQGGSQYSFYAVGSASNNGTSRTWGANGATSFNRHSGGAENGIADLNAPTASLVGVFLSNERPDATAAPESLDFAQIGLNYGTLAPKLKQPFFIGDGANRVVTAPQEATRLMLAVWDGADWNNNSGKIAVQITLLTKPDSERPVVTARTLTLLENAAPTLTASNLAATDPDSDAAALIFTIQSPPQKGRLEAIGRVLAGGDSFTQADIRAGRIVYRHGGGNDAADSFTFTVKDPAGNQTAVEVCDLTIVPVDDDAPVIEKHSLQVTQAAAVVLDTESLFATDTDTAAADLSFVLKSTPSHGSLAKDGRLLAVDSVFTQTDVAQGRIAYSHGGDAASSDLFVVLARDAAGNKSPETAVNVGINPTEDVPFVRYAVAPDQAMQYQGRNVFELDTNVRNVSGVRVASADDSLISPGDVSVEQTAVGKLRVTVRHNSNEFGVTALRFSTADGRVFAQIVVIVAAPPTTTWAEIGALSGEQSLKRLDDGSVQSERTLNARLPGILLRDGILSAAEAFRMVRSVGPVGSANAAISDDAEEVNEVVELQDAQTGEQVKSWHSRTRVSKSYTSPESAGAKARGYETFKDPYGAELIYGVAAPLPEVLGELGTHDPLDLLLAISDLALRDGVVGAAMELLRAYVAKMEFRIRRPGNPPSPDDARLTPEGEQAMRESLLQTIDAVDTVLLCADLTRLTRKLPKLLPEFVDKIDELVKSGKTTEAVWRATKVPLEVAQKVRDFVDGMAHFWERLVGRHTTGGSLGSADRAQLETDHQFIGALAMVSARYTTQIGGELREFSTQSESWNADVATNFDAAADLVGNQGQLIAEYLPGALPELSDLPVIPPPKVESGVPSDGTSPDDASSVDPATREANDENGDEEQKVNDELAKQTAKTDKVAKFVGTGKKVYDLLGSTRELVGNFSAFLDLLGGDSGDYADHDGKTYNVNEAQHRFGKAERDVINTGRRNDVVYAYGGDDRVTTGDGNDEVYLGAGRNHVFAGAGRDLIKDGAGDGMLSAGPGDDTIYPGAGSDYISGDTGRDLYAWDGRDVGVDLIVDPSRSGELRLPAFHASELALRKDNYDLVLELPKSPSGEANRVRLAGYFEQDAAGWTVTFADGIARNLYELTGRLTAYDSLQIAFGERTASGTPDYPAGISHLTTLHDAAGRFTLHLASDNRLTSSTPVPTSTVPGADILRPGLLLTIEGDSSLGGWLNRNRFGSLADSNDLLARFKQAFAFGDYSRVTIVGIGEGGLPAQWFATAAASEAPTFVNTQLINSPDLSGLISQVVRDEFPEYEHGARSLSTNFLVDAADWVSQIAIWSGEGRVRGTWKAFDFDYDADARPEAVSQLDDLQRAHAPAPGSVDFAKLKVSDLRLSHINGIVRLEDTNDFLQAVANVTTMIYGVAYYSTVSSLDVLIDEASLSSVTDQDVVEGARDRARFSSQLRHDPLAVDPSKPLIVSYDFGTADSPYDPTTSVRITSESRYPGVAAGVLAAGWQSTSGLKAIDRGRASEFERDAILVGDGVFLVNVKPGTYNVAVTYGDRETLREDVQLYLNGVAADRVTTMPGDFLTRTYQVTTTDGSLSLRFVDIGGKTDVGAIAGVSLEQVNFGAELPITEAMESDPAVIVMLEDYELPETNAGIEILKSALIAAATAVLTVGAGALLGMTQIGGSIAAGLGGNIASGAAASGTSIVVAGTQEVVRAGIVAGFKAAIGGAIKNAVLTSLVTSIPQNLVPNDTFRGIWSAGMSVFAGIGGMHAGAPRIVDGVFHPRDWLVQAHGAVQTLNGGLTAANTVLASLQGGADDRLAPWIYDFASSFAMMSRGFRAGRIDPAFVPVDVDEVLQALANGKNGKQLLRRWQGSRDYLVPDWLPDGEELTGVSEQEHREHVRHGSRAIVSLLTAYAETMRKTNPEAQLDVMFVAAGAAYDLVKEVTTRLNESDVAQALDFVKIVTLDPVTFGEETAKVYHPELNPLISGWDNYLQSERTPAGSLYHVGSSPGNGALDDRLRGGPAGAYNGKGRLFDVLTGEETLRFGHWDRNSTRFASAEMTDTEYSPDGRFLVTSDKGGNVTVRYASDVLDPETKRILRPIGEVAFTVYGQDSFVRSVSFAQIETKPGVWEDYLLTVSSPVDPTDTSRERNRVLLTELKTGRPAWQAHMPGGTQAEMSSSGNLLVAVDRDGNVQVWRRNADEVTSFTEVARRELHPLAGGAYIADLQVLNDRYFVTAGLDRQLKLSRVNDAGIEIVQELKFAGEVRNIAYDPYNGILAVGAGNETSLWRFELDQPKLTLMSGGGTLLRFTHHVGPVQGVAFSKPAFLFNSQGDYLGDRDLPRTVLGDVDRRQLPRYLSDRKLPGSLAGLKLATGGEDRTVLIYGMQQVDQGLPREERAIAGGMLPIRELSLSPDGRFVALVGQDNIDGEYGGFINDIDVTGALDGRLGWSFSEVFLQGRREHNAVPKEYLYQVAEIDGEPFFYQRNSVNANQPGRLDRSRRLDLPPNKREARPGIDVEPITIEARPGGELEIRPRRYLIDADREAFSLQTPLATPFTVKDAQGRVLGTLDRKRVNGTTQPNVLIFRAAGDLDFGLQSVYSAQLPLILRGPDDIEGQTREVDAKLTLNVVDYAPWAHDDVFYVYNDSQTEARPLSNDYDFDNDAFSLVALKATPLMYTTTAGAKVQVATASGVAGTNRIQVVSTLTDAEFASVLADYGAKQAASSPGPLPPPTYVPATLAYQVREDRYRAVAGADVEVRVRGREAPQNVRVLDVSAFEITLGWDEVGWPANRYRVELRSGTSASPVWTLVGVVDAPTTKITLSKFLNGGRVLPETEHVLRVVAVSERREVASVPLSVTTPASPLVPAAVDVPDETLGRQSFVLNLSHPERDRLAGITILLSSDAGRTWLGVENPSGTRGFGLPNDRETFKVSKIQVERGSDRYQPLQSGTTYLVQVWANYRKPDQSVGLATPISVTTKLRVAPEGVIAEALGPTSARLSFVHDGVGVTGFWVQKQNQAGEWVTHGSRIDSTVRSIDISNGPTKLIPGVQYRFRVVAEYPAASLASLPSAPLTMPNATGPRSVAVPDDTRLQTSVLVSWQAPSPAWDVADHRVELARAGADRTPIRAEVVGKNATSTIFKELAADTAYQVRVAARNLDLDSLTVWSDWMPVRTRAFVAPTATNATALGPTSVRVSFAHDGVGVKEFQFQKQNQAGDWVVHATGISSQVRSVDLSNGPTKLIPGVAYPFRVVAVYASTSVVGVASPAVRLPNATGPQNVQVPDSTIGRQKLTATWSAPSPAWDVADYRVELYRTGNLSTPWKTIVVDKSVTSATFTDLDINTSYRVRVLARNLDLDSLSVASVFAAASTKGFVAPSSLSFSDVTATALKVNWLHSDPVGAPESYVIFRNGARVGEVSATMRSFTDRGLKANTTYSYVVRAKYGLGNADSGAASQRTALR